VTLRDFLERADVLGYAEAVVRIQPARRAQEQPQGAAQVHREAHGCWSAVREMVEAEFVEDRASRRGDAAARLAAA